MNKPNILEGTITLGRRHRAARSEENGDGVPEKKVAVTKSWAVAAPAMIAVEKPPAVASGFAWLAAASMLVAAGLVMAYAGKSQSFAAADRLVAPHALDPRRRRHGF